MLRVLWICVAFLSLIMIVVAARRMIVSLRGDCVMRIHISATARLQVDEHRKWQS
jgi:hypothetical protein